MGKCLVQKLDGVVDNESLLKLNEVKFRLASTDNVSHFSVTSKNGISSPVTIKAINGTSFSGGTTEITVNAGSTESISYSDGQQSVDISIISKTDIAAIVTSDNGGSASKSIVTFLADAEYFGVDFINSATYDFDYHKFSSLGLTGNRYFGGQYCKICNLNLSDVVTHKRIPNVTRIYLGPTGIKGKVTAFAESINVIVIRMSNYGMTDNNKITGSLEELSEQLVLNGKDSGTLEYGLWDGINTKLLKTDTTPQSTNIDNVYYVHFNPAYTPEHAAVENVFFRNGFAISKSSTPPEV